MATPPTSGRASEPTLSVLGLLGLLALCAVLVARTVSAAPYSAVYTFGDSLSDSGNLIRASDGPVWIEYFGEYIGLPEAGIAASDLGDNHAVSAAAATRDLWLDLRAQLDRHLGEHPTSDPDALFVFYIGHNDLMSEIATSAEVLAEIEAAIDRLVATGARRFVVLDLWNMGLAPRYIADVAMSMRFLEASARISQAFGRRSDDVEITVVDVSRHAMAIRFDPQRYGFQNSTEPCKWSESCEGFAYWDDVHPTTALHLSTAKYVVTRLYGIDRATLDNAEPADVAAMIDQIVAEEEEDPARGFDLEDLLGDGPIFREIGPGALDGSMGPFGVDR